MNLGSTRAGDIEHKEQKLSSPGGRHASTSSRVCPSSAYTGGSPRKAGFPPLHRVLPGAFVRGCDSNKRNLRYVTFRHGCDVRHHTAR